MKKRQDVLSEQRGKIGIITLNRPEQHNALLYEMWQDVATKIRELGTQPDVRVIILRGAGEKAFTAGADITDFPSHRSNLEQAQVYHMAVEGAMCAIASAEQPVIAMIHGYCIGGGCELASACDLRIADERARFGIPATRLGIVLGIEELRYLLRLIGPAPTKDLLFTSRLLDTTEALRIGLINKVVPSAALEETVMQTAEQIAKNVPIAITAAKSLLMGLERGTDREELQAIQQAFNERALASVEYQENLRTFLEQNPAHPHRRSSAASSD